MKWFKHDTDARQDFKIKRLIRRFGMEGYGVYWSIIELLAFETKAQVEGDVQLSLERYPVEDISLDLGVSMDKTTEILEFMAVVGLIDAESYRSNILSCKALAKRCDEYTEKRRKKLGTRSGECRDSVGKEEKREEEKIREEMHTLWNSTPLPKILEWSKERKEKLGVRLESEHFRTNWRPAIERLARSSFALGKGNTGWKADINWFLSNDTNYVKILEGKYDDREQKDRFAKY